MRDDDHHRQSTWLPTARRTAASALAACLLTSCSTQETPDREADSRGSATASPKPAGEPDRTRSPAAGPTKRATLEDRLPAVPSVGSAATLARHLDLAARTLRDRRASAGEARRAGEFHQLAVRVLSTSSEGFRGRVIARLQPGNAAATRSEVRAARSLDAMGGPQPRLPRWRIVAPPPPAELLRYYRQAQRRTGVPWNYLAAIHLVETRMGRIRGTSTAGAMGPMQFLPSTWDIYGAGGDINRPRDAILAAARLLKAHGAPRDMADALWHYNQSDNYVRAVSEYARTMRRSSDTFHAYWHWRVLYQHERGTYVLPEGYPRARAVLVDRHRTTR